MVAAFKGGQVDAAVFPITTFRQVEADGSGKPIAYVGDEVPWQLGAVFTSPKTITERRPLVEKFLVGYRRGAAAYHEAFGKRENGKLVPGANYDEMIGILSNVVKQPPALIAAGLPYIDPEGRLDVGDIYKQVAFWQSTGQVSRDADPKSFIDLSFVQGHFNVPSDVGRDLLSRADGAPAAFSSAARAARRAASSASQRMPISASLPSTSSSSWPRWVSE